MRQLQEKEDVIRQLEEVNLSLKHTNDDLNNEVRNLKSRVELLNDEVCQSVDRHYLWTIRSVCVRR